MNAGARAWVGVAALLGAAALGGSSLPHDALDWQPALFAGEPWRAVSAVGVHYSALHLAANLVGLVIAALFGAVARVPPRLALAWLAAWPLTHVALLGRPDLNHYGGLSGVLHAGAAAVVVALLIDGRGAARWIGAAVAGGLLAKVASEVPWGAALQRPTGWDIAVAPLAHATGVLAGAGCAALALGWPRQSNATPSRA